MRPRVARLTYSTNQASRAGRPREPLEGYMIGIVTTLEWNELIGLAIAIGLVAFVAIGLYVTNPARVQARRVLDDRLAVLDAEIARTEAAARGAK